MILSRLQTTREAVRSPQFWTVFEDPYRVHREIWKLFADDPDRDRDFLFRLDRIRGKPVVFTLSERPPTSPSRLWKIESRDFIPNLEPGDLLRFSLRANPTFKRDGKRHDVVMEAKRKLRASDDAIDFLPSQASLAQTECEAWLDARSERLGFALLPGRTRVDAYEAIDFPKRSRNSATHTIRLAVCDLCGVLEVREPERFLESLRRGVGPAKAFGCGLMLVMRFRA